MEIALRGIKKKNVYIMQTIIVLLCAVIFAYLFYTNTKLTEIPGLSSDNGAPKFLRLFYGGFGEDSLNKPMDVIKIGQQIYVSDTNNKRIQVFDLQGKPLFMFGEEGKKPGQFRFPYGIAGDSKGNVYVADLYNGCISIFDAKGKFIKYFAENNPEENTIMAPAGIRIIDNKVYFTDIRTSRAYVFDLQGKKLLDVGKPGYGPGQLKAPNAITADKEGNIYVVDTGNQRVQVFDKTGKFLRIINGTADGTGSSIFVNPRGIGIDSTGTIYVISNLTHYIYGFDKNGKQVFVLGGNGAEDDKFSLPNGLSIDEEGLIYITDTTNQRIAVFQ